MKKFFYYLKKLEVIYKNNFTKLLFEAFFLLFIGFLEKLIRVIDKNYSIELEGFD